MAIDNQNLNYIDVSGCDWPAMFDLLPFLRTCLFYGKLDKFIWLYLPILILLIVNTIMCVYITYCVFKNR